MNRIQFHELDIKSSLKSKRAFKKFLIELFNSERQIVERIDIVFCTDEYLLMLNTKYLNHNYYTDTLSFLVSEPQKLITGEIYISIDRIISNAASLNIPYKEELLRVIIHSCLHLCGYLDRPKLARINMKLQQEKYLKDWFVSRET